MYDLPFLETDDLYPEVIVLASSAAATVTLQVGTDVSRVFVFGGPDTRTWPLRGTIAAGLNVSLTTTDGTCFGYIVADRGRSIALEPLVVDVPWL